MAEQYDVFISHASEDKRTVVLPLAEALKREGLKVWVDEQELQLGDSLRGKISEGLMNSRFGLVVLSPHFLAKQWPMQELRVLLAMEENGLKRIIFVRSQLSRHELIAKEPLIADRLDIEYEAGLDVVGQKIIDVVHAKKQITAVPVAIDLSHGQTKWNNLTSFVDSYQTPLRKIIHGILEESEVLSRTSVLIIPPPADDRHRLTIPEMDVIERWVSAGGGLLLMGCYGERHHGSNFTELAWRFDFAFNDDLLLPPGEEAAGHAHVFSTDPRYGVKITVPTTTHPLLDGTREIAMVSAASIHSTTAEAPEFLLESPSSSLIMRPVGHIQPNGSRPAVDWVVDRQGTVPLLATCIVRKGRVIVLGTWKVCTVDYGDNAKLVSNMLQWLAAR
jgi:TIR domain